MNTKRMITAEEARALLDYDPITGIFTRKTSGGGAKAGQPTGSIDAKGYLTIRLKYRLYFAHRLAWLIVHGEWPQNQIDHMDGVKSNNRISNLREATNSQNQANTPIKRNNTSGFKGVSWVSSKGVWEARTKLNNTQKFIGYFDNATDASAAYQEALKKNFGAFARA